MLFAEEDKDHLKAWIVQRLANTSDADSDVLADYVLALLRHEGDANTIRKLFEDEIPDFLREDSAAFTDDVFQAIKYKSYLPGAAPAPPVSRHPASSAHPILPASSAQQQSLEPFQHIPYAETPSAFSSPAFRNGSKKRSYRDLDTPEGQPMSWGAYAGAPGGGFPPYKQARRGAPLAPRGGRFEDLYAPRGSGGYGSYRGGPFAVAGDGFQNSEMPDAATIMENMRQLQELGERMGIHMPSAMPLPRPIYSGTAPMPGPHQRKRQPCRDYEKKGFCSRGNKCNFAHGPDNVYVPSFTPPAGDEYDPNNAAMPMLMDPNQPFAMGPFAVSPTHHRDFKKPKRKGGRSDFSAEGPTTDKTKTQLVVENIPEANFTEEQVRDFFGQFGAVEEVSLRPGQKRIAIIKFDSWAAAHAAWKSPKVVFDNRFVKIYWYKDEAAEVKSANGLGTASPNGEPAEPDFDVEEFKRKQEEAQKAHLERTQKRDALRQQMLEVVQKQQALDAQRQEEKRKLEARLVAHGERDASLSPILRARPTPDGAKSTQAEALKAKLAELEAEASSLGLDPHTAGDETTPWFSRGRGRGGRPYRGRGSFPPRAHRGGYGYRGRGGVAADVHTAYAAYSLDNRPKIVAVTGVDFTDPAKDEALRHYLFGIGEFTAIHSDPHATHITFKDRKTAEQFFFGVSANKTIPSVEGTVELSWASSAPKAAGADSDIPMASGLDEEQAANKATDEVDGAESFGGDGEEARDQGDMDYEGGDWDIA